MPTVSILANCYNGAKFLAEALESVYAQSYSDWEIIFCDNQSADESARIAKSRDQRMRYFYAPQHTPLGAARNLAIEKATGEYIAFLDCDDVWLPQKLARQMELFNKSPELVLVYSDSYIMTAEGKITGRMFAKRKPFAGRVYPQLLWQNFIPLLTTVARREAVVRAGGFCPDFHHAEDWDVFLRLAPLGPFDFVPDCLALYRVHNNSFHLKNWVLMTREEIELLERHIPSIRQLTPTQRKKIRRKMLSLHAKLAVKQLLREGVLPALQGMRASSSRYLGFRHQIKEC